MCGGKATKWLGRIETGLGQSLRSTEPNCRCTFSLANPSISGHYDAVMTLLAIALVFIDVSHGNC